MCKLLIRKQVLLRKVKNLAVMVTVLVCLGCHNTIPGEPVQGNKYSLKTIPGAGRGRRASVCHL